MAVNIRLGRGSNAEEVTLQAAQDPSLLIARCIRGEDRAWRDLHRDYYPTVARFLRRMGVTDGELDDACQEVFVQVFRYLARFQKRAELQTWLYKLCLSQASRIRRRRRMHSALQWLFGHSSPHTGMEWSTSQAAQRVRQALQQMKPMHREVFVLFELEGVDGQAIARILDCRPATVRRRLHYARQEFTTLLRADAAEEDKP